MKKDVILYGIEECPWTEKIKDLLEERKIAFKFKDVLSDLKYRDEMVTKTKQYSTPVVDVQGKIVIGLDRQEIMSAVFE